MLIKRQKTQGQAVIEYVALLILVIGALFVFQKYIAQGFLGRWRSTGDSFGYGGQYDPNTTIECGYDAPYASYSGAWYSVACFDEHCIDRCLAFTATPGECTLCLAGVGPPSHASCFIPECGGGL